MTSFGLFRHRGYQAIRADSLHAGCSAQVDRSVGGGGERGSGSRYSSDGCLSGDRSRVKDEDGSLAADPDNLICRAVQALKTAVPEVGVICDVALDPFTSHGQDGIVRKGEIERSDH